MKDLTVGREGPLILKFAIPMLIGNVFHQMYNIVDSIIVGKFLGKEALGAVGASFPILFIMIALSMGIASGAGTIISQYFGAKDLEKVKRTIDTINIFLFFISIILTIVGILLIDWLFELIKLPADIVPQAKTYLTIYFSGIILFFGYNGISSILRGLGDSKTPLYFMIISTLMNIGLDLLFILVFKWGIAGAAIATICSQGTAFLIAVLWLNKHHNLVHFSFFNLQFDWKIFLQSLRIGLPSGFQATFFGIGMTALYRVVNDHGTATVAAFAVAGRIDSFIVIPAMNFSQALSSFVGQNIGANKPERIRNGLRSTFFMTSAIASVISVLVYFFGRPIMFVFSDDLEVIDIGYSYLMIACPFYICVSTLFLMNGLLRGAGATLIPMFITLFSLWLIRIPVAYFLSLEIGVTGIWWGTPAAWVVGLTLVFFYYLSGKWKSKTVVDHQLLEKIPDQIL